MKSIKYNLVHIPIIGPIITKTISFFFRISISFRYFRTPILHLMKWLLTSNETTNFTYDLTPLNKRYLASLLADILHKPFEEIEGYITELDHDVELKKHINACIMNSKEKYFTDSDARYGRRIGWYAIARAIKPKIIIETGVDKGLGSCVLTSALMKNSQEGFPGYYYGTDINPKAGYLLAGKYSQFGRILYGDSITSLKDLDAKVDLFINDSEHSKEYEKSEFEIINPKLNTKGIILCDDSHVFDTLLNFALSTNRQYVFFREDPENHWYPGAGIGIAFKRD